MSISQALRREGPILLLLGVAVVCCFLTGTQRWRPATWSAPLAYEGDAVYYLAMAKASAESGGVPFLWKTAARLNAPAGAPWNDFPIVNEPLWTLLGVARKLFGVAGVTLWPLLLAHLLAAAGFYLAARLWGAERWTAAGLALLFACQTYFWRRNFYHLNLSFAWHLPLALLTVWWTAEARCLDGRRRWWVGLGAAFACGLQATYYSAFFLLLLAGAMALRLAAGEGWRRLGRPAMLAAVTFLLTLAANLDTLTWGWAHGPNRGAVQRSVAAVDLYALRPVELFLPTSPDPGWAERRAGERYYSQMPRSSERGTSYLGVVAGGALLLLLGVSFAALARDARLSVPPEAWSIALAVVFGIAGGGAMVLAVFGIRELRAGNRISILLAAAALLYLARLLGGLRPRVRGALVAALVAVGLWDQLPDRAPQRDRQAAQLLAADAALAAELEQALPGGAIFQLPVVLYPEEPRIHRLDPYELLRLYANSWTLRFSFGAHKGRGDDAWQRAVSEKPWPEAFAELRSRGFAAIAVYGRGYADRGDAMVEAIHAAGGVVAFRHAVEPIRVILLPRDPPAPARPTTAGPARP